MAVLVAALATGLVTSVVAATYMPARQPGFSRYFLTNILLFNLLILAGLVFRHLEFQLQDPALAQYEFLLPGLLITTAVLKLSWLYAFILMNRMLPADILPKRSAGVLAKAGAGILVAYLSWVATAWYMRHEFMLNAAVISLESIIFGGALIATLQLALTASRLPENGRRRSILVFAGYHLVLLGVIFTVLVTGWLQPGPQKLVQLFANGGFLILFNVFPLIWMRWFPPLQPVSAITRFEVLGITRREREIINLVQTGKTNQEIADELFISVATVKDHNHNIFRKTGVRNRLELANLFKN